MNPSFQIGTREVGADAPVLIIAELSANHNQDFELALRTIDAAKAAGADAIKLQTYTADTITLNSDAEPFRIGGGTVWDGQTLHAVYSEAYTPWDWQPKLKAHAENLGLLCFSSPFDPTSVAFLEEMNMPAYKVASLEIADIPLIQLMAKTGKPIIVSTGIAEKEDVDRAVKAIREAGNQQIALLKCTTAYPTPLNEVDLKAIPWLAETFQTIVGLSDHTMGLSVPIGATALGAKIIEKHLILDRTMGGPDSSFSLNPAEFTQMVQSVRDTEAALGQPGLHLTEKTKGTRRYGRSLFVVQDIAAGETLTEANIRSIRPADGLPPRHLPEVLGRKASRNLTFGEPLAWDDLA